MHGEAIAKFTGDHLRGHIRSYLDEVNNQFEDSKVATLLVPKSIDVVSVVGGEVTKFNEILPQYGIDILGKSRSEDTVALWTYEYPGQINGLVEATSQEMADRLVKRHAAAVEIFIQRHQFMHEHKTDDYSLIEFVFATVDFSGAEDMGMVNDRQVWLAGFSINCSWFLSENGPQQHEG